MTRVHHPKSRVVIFLTRMTTKKVEKFVGKPKIKLRTHQYHPSIGMVRLQVSACAKLYGLECLKVAARGLAQAVYSEKANYFSSNDPHPEVLR